ncbi:hypothetical protein BJ165DRAFT_192435 [Panaeolus papilionaceus]|nr:hypothetical protein BJ165DRAFT_192435 [Panaeolus papilionaceus]
MFLSALERVLKRPRSISPPPSRVRVTRFKTSHTPQLLRMVANISGESTIIPHPDRDQEPFWSRIKRHRVNQFYVRLLCAVSGEGNGIEDRSDKRHGNNEAAHLLPRECANPKNHEVLKLWEWVLGYRYGTLHLDTRLNGVILRKQIHTMLDQGHILFLIPEATLRQLNALIVKNTFVGDDGLEDRVNAPLVGIGRCHPRRGIRILCGGTGKFKQDTSNLRPPSCKLEGCTCKNFHTRGEIR